MRFVLYNIRYGTGGKALSFPWSGFLGKTEDNINHIIQFLRNLAPDVVGLVEVDAGSYRSNGLNQANLIANSLGHEHVYCSKYEDQLVYRATPILNKQGNALLSKEEIQNTRFHYFSRGMKRLVIEIELENVVIFLVHLALGPAARHNQLGMLYNLIRQTDKPCILAGDFNSFRGEKELELFLAATRLTNATDAGAPSFPSWEPRRQLDYILHSPSLKVERFWMPQVIYSDHLPLICDFKNL